MPPRGPDATSRAVLALIGLRCSGKTTLGRELARRLSVDFVDLDDEIVAQARATTELGDVTSPGVLLVADVERFRDLEELALERVLSRERPCVLATGGGVVERAANRARLAHGALCLWLQADLETLRGRLRADRTFRPALGGGDAADELADQLARRAPRYGELAGLRLDTSARSPAELVAGVVPELDAAARPRFALSAGGARPGSPARPA